MSSMQRRTRTRLGAALVGLAVALAAAAPAAAEALGAPVKRTPLSAERVEFEIKAPFLETMNAFESQMGWSDQPTWERMVAAGATWEEVRAAAGKMEGPHRFMIFHRVPTGLLLSLSGRRKNANLYVVGNPVIANSILDEDIAGGLYVPFRVYVFDRGDPNVSYIAYDRPRSLLGSLDNPKIDEVGAMLDEKMRGLIAAVEKEAR